MEGHFSCHWPPLLTTRPTAGGSAACNTQFIDVILRFIATWRRNIVLILDLGRTGQYLSWVGSNPSPALRIAITRSFQTYQFASKHQRRDIVGAFSCLWC